MDAMIERLYQEIGQHAEALSDNAADKILVYAEVEDGMNTCAVFYNAGEGVRYRDCSAPLQEAVYSLWERWQRHPGNQEWRTLTYVISGTSFDMELRYPHQLDEDEWVHDRRPRVVKAHFGDGAVDFSSP